MTLDIKIKSVPEGLFFTLIGNKATPWETYSATAVFLDTPVYTYGEEKEDYEEGGINEGETPEFRSIEIKDQSIVDYLDKYMYIEEIYRILDEFRNNPSDTTYTMGEVKDAIPNNGVKQSSVDKITEAGKIYTDAIAVFICDRLNIEKITYSDHPNSRGEREITVHSYYGGTMDGEEFYNLCFDTDLEDLFIEYSNIINKNKNTDEFKLVAQV